MNGEGYWQSCDCCFVQTPRPELYTVFDVRSGFDVVVCGACLSAPAVVGGAIFREKRAA